MFLEPSQTSEMKAFCEISQWLLAVNYFCERMSSQKLDWVLNTPLILSSNVIWYAYWSRTETNIFMLVVSLICSLFVKKEKWLGKKLYYRKTTYITSNTENFKVYLPWTSFLITQYKSTLNLHLLYVNIYPYISYYPI